MKIFNNLGKQIYRYEIDVSFEEFNIPVGNLPDGYYYLVLNHSITGVVHSEKIVKLSK